MQTDVGDSISIQIRIIGQQMSVLKHFAIAAVVFHAMIAARVFSELNVAEAFCFDERDMDPDDSAGAATQLLQPQISGSSNQSLLFTISF